MNKAEPLKDKRIINDKIKRLEKLLEVRQDEYKIFGSTVVGWIGFDDEVTDQYQFHPTDESMFISDELITISVKLKELNSAKHRK